MTLSAPTSVLSSSSSVDQATYTTGSALFPAGSRVIMFISSGQTTGVAETPSSVTHSSMGAMTLLKAQPISNNNGTLTCWTGVGTGTNGTFTITHTGVMGNCLWQAFYFTSNNGTPTVAQAVVSTTSPNAGTEGATLGSVPASTSCTVGGYMLNLASTETITVGSGFTAIGARVSQSGPTLIMIPEYDNTSPPQTASFTPSVAARHSIMALEIADAVVTAGLPATIWTGTAEVSVTVTLWDGTTEITAKLE